MRQTPNTSDGNRRTASFTSYRISTNQHYYELLMMDIIILRERLTALYSSPYVWIWTWLHVLLTWTGLDLVLTWTGFHVGKKMENAAETGHGGGAAADVIIVGAGVAGSALAYALAKDGRRVHVIERDLREPDRMVGEVMQPGGRLMLTKLGLEDCLEEIEAQKMTGLAIYKDGKQGIAPFPIDNYRFPYEPRGRSFHNGRFVQRLRQKAASLLNVHMEEGIVDSLVEEKGVIKGVKYKRKSTGEETMAFAPLTFVCDGACSHLRRSLHGSKAKLHTYMVGYISKNCRLEDPESLHLLMLKHSLAILYQISRDEVRCAVEVPSESLLYMENGDMTTFFKNVFTPEIPPKLRDIFMKGIDEGAEIKMAATKSMTAFLSDKKGVIVLGDALNMRHPVTAAGMMVALSDVVILRDLLRPMDNLGDAKKLFRVLKSFHRLRKPMSATVNILADAFHQVSFASRDEAREGMRQGCFDYLCRGGVCTSGLMALIGGMNPRPVSLVFHLFAITLSSIASLLFPFPTPHRVWHSLRLLRLALGMLGPYLKDEVVTQMSSDSFRISQTLHDRNCCLNAFGIASYFFSWLWEC